MSIIIIVVPFVVVSHLVAHNRGRRVHVLVFFFLHVALSRGNERLRICPERPSLVLESEAPASF